MKKTSAILLSLALLCLTMTGCGTERGSESAAQARESSAAASVSESIESVPPAAEEISGIEAVASLAPGPAEPERDNDWEFASPESHGMDGEMLAQLQTAVEPVGINAIVTIKDGYVINEYYKDGFDETSVFRLNSCSKSFTGALVGLAIEQGLIGGVDDKLIEYLPQVAGYDNALKQDITIGHLLTHRSGLEWHEWGGNSSSWRPFRSSENWVDFILSQTMVAQPGAYFAYNTGGSHLLAAVLQEATGKSALEYGREYMFDPMGMDSVEWGEDPQGIMDGGNGIAMTARDAAKFGTLYLNGGKWRDRQILPEEWTKMSVERIVPGADNAAAYGYQWWIRTCGEGNYEVWYAMGAGGQFILVVPELELVTVMASSRLGDTYLPRAYFIDYILAAYTGTAAG